jgi:magnesium-transporting ATPase (P-type)
VQIKTECDQLLEMAAAFGVRALGTALVVISSFTNFRDKRREWLPFNHCQSIEVDYQSGPERPHSKGSANLIYAHASSNCAHSPPHLTKTAEFLGLALLLDPPRTEVPGAIRRAQDAGIRVVMVTGDHPATAPAVAREVGIRPSRVLTGLELETMPAEALSEAVREAKVFARVAPEHKLRLVEALKQNGE